MYNGNKLINDQLPNRKFQLNKNKSDEQQQKKNAQDKKIQTSLLVEMIGFK